MYICLSNLHSLLNSVKTPYLFLAQSFSLAAGFSGQIVHLNFSGVASTPDAEITTTKKYF